MRAVLDHGFQRARTRYKARPNAKKSKQGTLKPLNPHSVSKRNLSSPGGKKVISLSVFAKEYGCLLIPYHCANPHYDRKSIMNSTGWFARKLLYTTKPEVKFALLLLAVRDSYTRRIRSIPNHRKNVFPDHKIKVVNTGQKAVNAYTVQNLVPGTWKGWVGSVLNIDPPLQPGDSDRYQVWPEITNPSQVRIAAVVFTDGTHTGHVNDLLCGKDVIACIFETRKGWADGYAELAKRMSAMSSDSLKTFSKPEPKQMDLSKAIADLSAYHRAYRDILHRHDSVIQQKQAEVQAGKINAETAVQELYTTWHKAQITLDALATDKGEAK